jgi:hypothetical protein
VAEWLALTLFNRDVRCISLDPVTGYPEDYHLVQNGGRSGFWVGSKDWTGQRGIITFCMLIALQRVNTFHKNHLFGKPNYEICWNLKFIFCFLETILEPFHLLLNKLYLVQQNIMGIPESFVWIIILLNKSVLSAAVTRHFEVMLDQTLNHHVYNSVILCTVMSSKTI